MTAAAPKPPTLADLDALPEHIKGEIIEGVLHTMTRPRAPHQDVAGAVVDDLRSPFQRARGGPGGWWILPEPGIELPGSPEFSPDVAGWRRDRLPALPADHSIDVVPDWIAEVLSPTTRRHNLLIKKPFYARAGVAFLWLVDLDARVVSAHRLESGAWLEIATAGEGLARLPPFAAIEIDITAWWEGLSQTSS
jgi:Uma2 family endonuclease